MIIPIDSQDGIREPKFREKEFWNKNLLEAKNEAMEYFQNQFLHLTTQGHCSITHQYESNLHEDEDIVFSINLYFITENSDYDQVEHLIAGEHLKSHEIVKGIQVETDVLLNYYRLSE